MISRRGLLRGALLASGSGVLASSLAPAAGAGLQPVDGRSLAVTAGRVRVEPGPWRALPVMPDGVRLNAFLYLPTAASPRARVPVLLGTLTENGRAIRRLEWQHAVQRQLV